VGSFRRDRLRSIAEAAGLDLTSYDSCMAVGDIQTAVRSETNQATAQGVQYTPTLYVNGMELNPPGVPAYNDLVSIINGAAASPIP
jgi:predicted DsbA family dithiol-disulfide isomerase